MKRNLNLDFLKIIACFAVVVLHVAGNVVIKNNSYTISHFIYYASNIAVPIFFMVNRYFILNKDNITYKYIFKKYLIL